MGTDMQTIIVPASIKDFKDLRDYADFMHSYLTASQVTKDIVAYALTRLSEDQVKQQSERMRTTEAPKKAEAQHNGTNTSF